MGTAWFLSISLKCVCLCVCRVLGGPLPMPLPQQRGHTLQQKVQESVRHHRTATQGQHRLRRTTTVRQRRCDGFCIRLQVQQNIAISPE